MMNVISASVIQYCGCVCVISSIMTVVVTSRWSFPLDQATQHRSTVHDMYQTSFVSRAVQF